MKVFALLSILLPIWAALCFVIVIYKFRNEVKTYIKGIRPRIKDFNYHYFVCHSNETFVGFLIGIVAIALLFVSIIFFDNLKYKILYLFHSLH